MAYQTSSFVISNINFGFEEKCPEIYNEAYKMAYQIERNEYEEDKMSEDEEFKDGLIKADEREYTAAPDTAMKSHKYQNNIKFLTNKIILEAAEIPYSIVVTFNGDLKIEDVTNEMINEQVKEKYGIGMVSFNKDYPHSEDILRQKTADSVSKVFESGDYKAFLKIKESLRSYSFNNICMVYSQYPDAQAVKGFKAWKSFDREVVKGKGFKAIEIWCPKFTILNDEEQANKYVFKMYPKRIEPIYADPNDPDSNIIGEIDLNERHRNNLKEKIMKDIDKKGKYERLDGYRTGKVYDISQTQHIDPKTGNPDPDHDNIDEIINRDKKLEAQLADVKDITAAINDTFFIHNYSSQCNKSDSEDIFQSIHKYAEYKLHNDPTSIMGIKSSGISKGAVAEAETLIGAGLICEHIGIKEALDKVGLQLTKVLKPNDALENVENFKKYIDNGGTGRAAVFKEAFTRGSALAADFNAAYDKAFEEIMKLNKVKTKEQKEAEYER